MKIEVLNEQEMALLGAELWRVLPKKCLVFLKGDLGAGKTTLTRGVLRASGYMAAVKSPTYTLVEEYDTSKGKFFHFDLYRIQDPGELEWMGMSDYLGQQSLCFIEWAEKGQGFLPIADIEIAITVAGVGREVDISILSKDLISKLKLKWKNNNIVL